jgi:hypothetical protein
VAQRPNDNYNITLSNRQGSGGTRADPPICMPNEAWKHEPRLSPIWMIGAAVDARPCFSGFAGSAR